MISTFDISIYFQKKELLKHFTKSRIDGWMQEAKQIYKSLVLQIPDIGGKKNGMSSFLNQSVIIMPIVIIMKKNNIPIRKIGEVIFNITASAFSQIPMPLRWIFSARFFNKSKIQKWKKRAERSRLRKFSEDFVFDFIEGNGFFKFGYEITECAICKFWRSQGLEEFVTYLCLTDWAKWRMLGINVSRSRTLANGGKSCDFRYLGRGSNASSGWPPESVQEWTGIYETIEKDHPRSRAT